MKKTIAHIFIGLVLLNVCGLYGVFKALQLRNDHLVNIQIDNDALQQQAIIVIKIPLPLPYANSDENFERVLSEFEHNGELYRMVSKRMFQDTLTILCLKDNRHNQIADAISKFVKSFADRTSDEPFDEKISFIKDYLSNRSLIVPSATVHIADVIHCSGDRSLTASFSPAIIHPPERG